MHNQRNLKFVNTKTNRDIVQAFLEKDMQCFITTTLIIAWTIWSFFQYECAFGKLRSLKLLPATSFKKARTVSFDTFGVYGTRLASEKISTKHEISSTSSLSATRQRISKTHFSQHCFHYCAPHCIIIICNIQYFGADSSDGNSGSSTQICLCACNETLRSSR